MLSIHQVSYQYRGSPVPALAAVSLDVPGTGVYGLLGPNGAGKTTLISLLSGLLAPQGGEIRLNGLPLAQARREDPRAIALVPQDYAFYPMLTVLENLRFFAGVLGLAPAVVPQRVEASLAFARLEQVLHKRAEHLSGGLRRRLNLAIGLLGKPRLLLLDEPTVGVDPQSRHFLLDAIAALPGQGTEVIYTSHYMEEVQAICRDLAILDQGRVLASGPLESLLADGETLLELNGPEPLPEALASRYAARLEAPRTYRLCLPAAADLAALLAELQAAGIALQRLSFGRQNLEQVFMGLTRRSLRD